MANAEASLDWGDAANAPVRPANLVVVQRSDDEIVLTFGHAAPPPSADDSNPTKVQQVARFSITITAARVLARSLQHGLSRQEEPTSEQDTTP